MRYIPLTQGQFAIVDDEDYEDLSKYKWNCAQGYARRIYRVNVDGKKKTVNVNMHRVLMNTPKGMHTDHINMNRLDNRKSNLRICTINQNLANTRSREGSSIYKGVSYHGRLKRWAARVQYEKKMMNLGYYDSEVEAAKVYNRAAAQIYGEFARLNEINEED